MPDFERLTRSLEMHMASTPEEQAFVRGKHAGEDAARMQILKIFIVCVAAVAAFHIFL